MCPGDHLEGSLSFEALLAAGIVLYSCLKLLGSPRVISVC